jgi:hypothetical protein
MNKFFIVISATFFITAGAALAQQFTTSPRVTPQPVPSRPSVEQNSNSSWFKKFQAAPNKLQLINPAAPRQYGSGEQVVIADTQDPMERPKFLRLLSITF